MVRIGVVGTSWITEEFIRCASLVEDFQLSAVYSRTEEKAKSFGEKYGVNNVFTDLKKMAQSNNIDAVYIASPNSFHAEQSILFLNHKKHVLCEKPIASNVRELEEMIEAAQSNKVLLMEAMKTTFLPNYKVIAENLHKLGKIRRYFASYCQYSSKYDAYKDGEYVNAFDPKLSNGSIMDIGIYCIYPLINLFGMPNTIEASAIKLASEVDGQGSISLSYEGMEAVIMHSKIANSYIPCEIQGEKGSIIIDKINNTEKVHIIYRDGKKEDLSVPQLKETMYYEAKEFVELIKLGELESKINSYKLSLQVMKTIEKSRKKAGIVFPADIE